MHFYDSWVISLPKDKNRLIVIGSFEKLFLIHVVSFFWEIPQNENLYSGDSNFLKTMHA